MPTSPLAPLVQHLRDAARPPDAGLTDGELLDLFLAQRDEAAFAELVRRHGPMVLGVCRRVLRDAHEAEDAFQATFLVLARKADSVRPREMVGNWLHGVAYRTALKAKSLAARRREKERQVREMSRPEPLDPEALDDLRARLDRELQRLPADYRAAVVLCDLEGKPRQEAAFQLGLPEGTLSSRLSRGRRLLAQRLAGGDALPAGALAALLCDGGASAAVPSPLLMSTSKAGALVAAGQAVSAVAPAKVAALTEGVLQAMFVEKVKLLLAWAVAVVVVGVGSLVAPIAFLGEPTGAAEPIGNRHFLRTPHTLPEAPVEVASPAAQDEKPKRGKREKPKPAEKEKKQAQPGRARAEEAITKSFTTKGKGRVVVETFNGPVEVKTGAAGTTSVRVVKSAEAATKEAAEEGIKNVDVELKQEGDTVRVTAKTMGEMRQVNRGASVEVEVPPGAALELRSSNGKVAVTGPTGNVAAASSNGRVEVKGSKGSLRLKTSNGAIRVEGGAGALDLNTTNGGIDVKASGAKVKAHTSNGAIHFAGTLAAGDHSFETSNGNVAVALPGDARFRLDAQTNNGRVTCDFPHKQPDKKRRTRLQTSVGESPTMSLKLRSSNGNINVQPAKGAEE